MLAGVAELPRFMMFKRIPDKEVGLFLISTFMSYPAAHVDSCVV